MIADRYLCDFDVELSIRFQKEQRLAMLLRRALEALAPKSRRTYLMCLDPALPRHRKPASDCRNLDPADLQARYDALVGRYGLRVYDASVPLEELASALVHDARCLTHPMSATCLWHPIICSYGRPSAGLVRTGIRHLIWDERPVITTD